MYPLQELFAAGKDPHSDFCWRSDTLARDPPRHKIFSFLPTQFPSQRGDDIVPAVVDMTLKTSTLVALRLMC